MFFFALIISLSFYISSVSRIHLNPFPFLLCEYRIVVSNMHMKINLRINLLVHPRKFTPR